MILALSPALFGAPVFDWAEFREGMIFLIAIGQTS